MGVDCRGDLLFLGEILSLVVVVFIDLMGDPKEVVSMKDPSLSDFPTDSMSNTPGEVIWKKELISTKLHRILQC